mgnify:CR=1 FL=1
MVDGDGNLQTGEDQTPAEGWDFEIYEWVNPPTAKIASATTQANGNTNQISFIPKTGTQYKVKEIVKSNYVLLSAFCTNNNNPVGNFGSDNIYGISAKAGDDISCTFINSLNTSIKIIKNTGGIDETFTFTSNLPGSTNFGICQGNNAFTCFPNSPNGQVYWDKLPPEVYTITEDEHPGWELSNIVCDTDATIDLPNRKVDINLTFGKQSDFDKNFL